MYSRANGPERANWTIEARTPDGPRDVSWSDMPLADRLGAWRLDDVPRDATEERHAICLALLEGAREVRDGVSGIAVIFERRTLSDGELTIEREVTEECGG